MRGLPPENSKKEFELGYQGLYFLLRTKFMLNSFVSLICYRCSYPSDNSSSARDCLPESLTIATVIISKQLFHCSWYSVTFTKTYLQSF